MFVGLIGLNMRLVVARAMSVSNPAMPDFWWIDYIGAAMMGAYMIFTLWQVLLRGFAIRESENIPFLKSLVAAFLPLVVLDSVALLLIKLIGGL